MIPRQIRMKPASGKLHKRNNIDVSFIVPAICFIVMYNFIDVLKIRKFCCLKVKKFILISKFSLLHYETEIWYLKFEGCYDASLSLFLQKTYQRNPGLSACRSIIHGCARKLTVLYLHVFTQISSWPRWRIAGTMICYHFLKVIQSKQFSCCFEINEMVRWR